GTSLPLRRAGLPARIRRAVARPGPPRRGARLLGAAHLRPLPRPRRDLRRDRPPSGHPGPDPCDGGGGRGDQHAAHRVPHVLRRLPLAGGARQDDRVPGRAVPRAHRGGAGGRVAAGGVRRHGRALPAGRGAGRPPAGVRGTAAAVPRRRAVGARRPARAGVGHGTAARAHEPRAGDDRRRLPPRAAPGRRAGRHRLGQLRQPQRGDRCRQHRDLGCGADAAQARVGARGGGRPLRRRGAGDRGLLRRDRRAHRGHRGAAVGPDGSDGGGPAHLPARPGRLRRRRLRRARTAPGGVRLLLRHRRRPRRRGVRAGGRTPRRSL
ncbi:MAG: hypothetical protein AVDCRST_MAG07-275, partial [uncultured Frankineae bacterium]